MTDRELLEAAAKAAGYQFSWVDHLGCLEVWAAGDKVKRYWQPHRDDGDALRLAVKLRMVVSLADCCCCATVDWDGNKEDNEVRVRFDPEFADRECGDAASATRRAIVRAAAAMAG